MRQCAGLLPSPLAAYNLCCVRRDGGRIDATPALQIGRLYWELGSAHEKSAASIASRSRIRLDASREPDRVSIACPGGHVGTTSNIKACRRVTTAVDRLPAYARALARFLQPTLAGVSGLPLTALPGTAGSRQFLNGRSRLSATGVIVSL